LNWIDDLANQWPSGLIEGYSEMAMDTVREREAEEWSEALIGAAAEQV
jgi:hypothetical protein